MPEPTTTALLLDYFEEFLQTQDAETFRRKVASRYNEGTLARLVQSGDVAARRASIVSLGLVGSYKSNAIVARAMRDSDSIVRNLAENALWAIWYRADTPENNATLQRIRGLLRDDRLSEALDASNGLIERSPQFAEAYNQRAIAYFIQGRFEESAADCRRVLHRNPYHIGALQGLAKCYIELDRRAEAIVTFRRALELTPFDGNLRQTISLLEAGAD